MSSDNPVSGDHPVSGDDNDINLEHLNEAVANADAEAEAKANADADADANAETPEELDPVAALEAERDELKDQALRALAEVENMRRRTEREVAQSRKYGHSGFARDLLSAVDNLKRAVDVLPEDRSGLDDTMSNLVIGVEMIHQEIMTVLERHGITVINPEGEKFDYEKHQAMFEIPSEDAEPGTILQVAQPGWMLHDRLLTPAMVGVAKAPETSTE
ncbi:MAG: nucleotide exchange factor GrpE [Alphaproteobacteria bacterium]|nr:nucleotide exchange factor GrpE [Alphaproteobacteria bacterium]